jgi:hypothetical protein
MGELELLLADRIVSCGWRVRRLLRVESRLFKEDSAQLEQAFSNYGREKMPVLSRYEATIERSLLWSLLQLSLARGCHRSISPFRPMGSRVSD